MGIQMGKTSKLGWLIGFIKHAICADSLYFLPAVTLNFQNPRFPSAYTKTLFKGMLE
jgi:hypothetical protein